MTKRILYHVCDNSMYAGDDDCWGYLNFKTIKAVRRYCRNKNLRNIAVTVVRVNKSVYKSLDYMHDDSFFSKLHATNKN